MDLSFNFLAPIELISSGFLTWIKGKWEKSWFFLQCRKEIMELYLG
jgi:hypothetical protein